VREVKLCHLKSSIGGEKPEGLLLLTSGAVYLNMFILNIIFTLVVNSGLAEKLEKSRRKAEI
jgi:hypothetical protein